MTINTNKETVLILGGSGLLGYHCSKVFSSTYNVVSCWSTRATDDECSEQIDVLKNDGRIYTLLEKYKPQVIINTIGYVTVDGCETNPEVAKSLNSTFVNTLVDAMTKSSLINTHLIQISTDSVYGNNKTNLNIKPWQESDSLSPLSIYAKTKLDGENEAKKHVGPYSILRTAFYGINPYSTKSLLWWIINNARNGNPMDGWENIFFSPVSARTLAETIKNMVENKIVGVYNIGSIDACNKYDFVDAVCSNLNIPVELNRVTVEKTSCETIRPNYSVLDCAKLQDALSWEVEWRNDLQNYLKALPPFPEK